MPLWSKSNPLHDGRERQRLLVTGFGPFLDVKDNPSAWLAERSGHPFRILDVSFAAVDRFFEEVDLHDFEVLLMLGIAAKSESMRLEFVARNFIGETLDVAGSKMGPAPIDPCFSGSLSATAWTPVSKHRAEHLIESVDAGDYLCNYALFRALTRFPEKKVGFLHVPPPSAIDLHAQLKSILQLTAALTSIAD